MIAWDLDVSHSAAGSQKALETIFHCDPSIHPSFQLLHNIIVQYWTILEEYYFCNDDDDPNVVELQLLASFAIHQITKDPDKNNSSTWFLRAEIPNSYSIPRNFLTGRDCGLCYFCQKVEKWHTLEQSSQNLIPWRLQQPQSSKMDIVARKFRKLLGGAPVKERLLSSCHPLHFKSNIQGKQCEYYIFEGATANTKGSIVHSHFNFFFQLLLHFLKYIEWNIQIWWNSITVCKILKWKGRTEGEKSFKSIRGH